MRILIVDPGFEYSTLAVARGYYRAFERKGYEILSYDMFTSLKLANKALSDRAEISIHQITELACAPILNTIIQDKIQMMIMVHGYYMNPSIVMSARKLGCKTALILTDDPMQVDISTQWSRYYDHVFTNERRTVRSHGKNCHFLPMAVDEEIFKPQEVKEEYQSEILIAGSMYKERIDFIDQNPKLQDLLLNHNTCIVGSSKSKFQSDNMNSLVRGKMVSYEEMALYTAGAKVCIDMPRNEFVPGPFGFSNRNFIEASCVSPRIFECGASNTTCLTNNRRSDIRNLFKHGFPTYDEPEDLCEKIEFCLREKIDRHDLYEETLDEHTYMHRVSEMEKILDLCPTRQVVFHGFKNTPIIHKLTDQWEINYKENKSQYSAINSVKWIRRDNKKLSSDQIDIVSNGPTLDVNYLEKLNRSNTIMTLLLNDAINHIVPVGNNYYAMAIHPGDELYERSFLNRTLFCALIASTLVNHNIVKKFVQHYKPLYFFNTSKEEGIKEQVIKETGYPVIGSGLTVGYSALALAVYLGFKKVNVFGLDFAFVNNMKYYKESAKLEDIKERCCTTMESVSGKIVLTTDIMFQSRNSCLKLIEENPEVEFTVYGDGILYSKKLTNLVNKEYGS